MRAPLSELLEKRRFAVIDGAMSTALEVRGLDLKDPLWTAKALVDSPQEIRAVHRSYFEAGADIAITASYQASEAGFARRGIGPGEAAALIGRSVELARGAARDSGPGFSGALVAGSAGPYGAFLADGSEYTGAYRLSAEDYRRFHRLRLEALCRAGADLIAFETQPRLDEIKAELSLLEEFPLTCWVTVTLDQSGTRMPDGTPLDDLARVLDAVSRVEAVGVNCVPRQKVSGALRLLARGTGKPLIAYPNSGETWDAGSRTWKCLCGGGGAGAAEGWERFVPEWLALGARCIGGCCRTLPADIRAIAALVEKARAAGR
ncbi:MAG: homocysteine S-methyltransferase [Mesosutterella sp.]|nr:homocysteine S-methyltransferase [Mesosutterella sp.]